MTAPLTVRPATPADLDAVWRLCLTVKTQLIADGIFIWDEGYPNPQVFTEDIAAGGLLAAFRGPDLVGALAFNSDHAAEYYFDLPAGEADAQARALLTCCGTTPQQAVGLHRLMTAPSARRSGVAAALLAEAARQSGGKRLTLLVAEANAPARALYDKLGFTDHGSFAFSFGSMRLLALPPA